MYNDIKQSYETASNKLKIMNIPPYPGYFLFCLTSGFIKNAIITKKIKNDKEKFFNFSFNIYYSSSKFAVKNADIKSLDINFPLIFIYINS